MTHPVGMPMAIEGRGASWNFIAEAREIAEKHAGEIEVGLDAREDLQQLSWEWIREEGERVEGLTAHANYADLAIVSRTEAPTIESRFITDFPTSSR